MRAHRPGGWLGIAIQAAVVASPVAGEVVVTPIIYPGAPADFLGPGVVFDQGAVPVMNSDGTMLILASPSGPGVTPLDNFVFVRGQPDALSLVFRAGSPAPGLPAGVSITPTAPNVSPFSATYLFDDLGNIHFSSVVSGTGVTSANDGAAWFGPAPSFPLLMREGSQAQGLAAGVNFSAFLVPRVHAGVIVGTGVLSGAGVTGTNDGMLYYKSSTLAGALVREGDPIPGTTPGVAGAPVVGGIEEDGRVLFRVSLTGGAAGDAGLFLGTPGNLTRLARVLDQAADLPAGVQYETFGGMDVDGLGNYAFYSLLQGAGSPTNDEAIFFGPPGGFRKVVRFGDAAPGLAGATFGAQTVPQMAACNGSLVFRARLAGAGVSTANDDSLWLYRAGTLTLLVREGAPVPGLAGVNFGPVNFVPSISAEGAVVFQTPLTGAITASNNEALFLRRPDGALIRLLRKGDVVTLPAGGSRTITQMFLAGRSRNFGAGRAVIGGRVALQASVLDPGGGNDQSITLLIDAGEVLPPTDPAWTIPQAFESNTNSGVHGTSFEIRDDVEVTALGYYDDLFSGGEGLDVPHPVGIYDVATRELVASISVPAGTAAPRENLFRYAEIPPARLTAGREYIVAAVSTGDFGHNVAASAMSVGPGVILGTWRSGGGGPGLSYPNTAVNTTARFMGPSFKYRLAPPRPPCPADLDDGSGTGTPDQGVTIDDLVYFLGVFASGSAEADLDDDGLDPGTPDGGVTIDDLIFFLGHFTGGC